MLREQLGGMHLLFTDGQRRRLAAKAKAIRRNGLFEIGTLVTADTLLRWIQVTKHKPEPGSAVYLFTEWLQRETGSDRNYKAAR